VETEQNSSQWHLGQGRKKKEIKDFLEFNENEATKYPNLWDTMKAFLRRKLIAMTASKKKLERAHTSSLTTHLKALEEKEANSPKRSRQQEIIKLRGEINQVETRRVLFSFQVNVGFPLFMLLLKISLRPWWSDRIHGKISIFFYLLRPVLWPIIWSILEKVPWGAEKKVYPFVLG